MTTSKSRGQIAFETYWKDFNTRVFERDIPAAWDVEPPESKVQWEEFAEDVISALRVGAVEMSINVPTSVPSLMRGVTDDPKDPRLTHGVDSEPTGQADVYLVLSDEERRKGFVRPVRRSYVCKVCKVVTTMGVAIAETYARNPKFYGATYCTGCQMHRPVSKFTWDGTDQVVGS
jgi:hypothetical protein